MFFGFAFLFHVIKKKLKGPGPSSARMTFYRYLAGSVKIVEGTPPAVPAFPACHSPIPRFV